MVTDCSGSCTKCFLTFINFIFFVFGSFSLILALWLSADKGSFIALTNQGLNNQHLQIPPEVSDLIQELNRPSALDQIGRILLFVGGFIFIVSLFGYCGAVKESRFMLVMYSTLLIVIVMVEVLVISMTAAYKHKVEHRAKEVLRTSLKQFYSGDRENPDAVTLAWNFVMAELHCCGVDNFTDFRSSPKFQEFRTSHLQILPPACCILNAKYPPYFEPEDENCLTTPTTYNSYFLKGCYSMFRSWLLSHLNPVLISVICLVTVEIIAVIFSFCLCKAVERDLRRK